MRNTLTHLICSDWSKYPARRQAVVGCVKNASVTKLDLPEVNLVNLLECARNLACDSGSKVLVSIDAAIGIPNTLPKLEKGYRQGDSVRCFIEWLQRSSKFENFWNEVSDVRDWSSHRPFVKVVKGQGALSKFLGKGELNRQIDKQVFGKSPLVVCGIPGTVGGASRALWQELAQMLESKKRKRFSLWPFEGSLKNILKNQSVVIAEIYPALCYGIVLSDSLPASRLLLSKTKKNVRKAAIELLEKKDWFRRYSVSIDVHLTVENEDLFDATMACLAQLRCVLENRSLDKRELRYDLLEGGVLLSENVDSAAKGKKIFGDHK